MDSSILGSHYLVPIVLLIITMISLGISSALIISIFKIKNNFYIFIISALLATFPVLALGFGYLFMVERYVLGILVGILATYITNKYKYGFILGGVFLAITLGYYQSYISITIGLSMFLILIKGFGNINMENYLIYILKFLLMGILGVFLYLIMVKVTCHLSGTSLFEYKGINNMGSLPPLNEIPGLIKRTYGHFLGFFLGKYFLKPLNYGLYVQLILLFINSILILMIVIKNKIYKNILKLCTISLFLILLPLGLNIIDFIAYQSNVSSLNIYQFVLILILPFILFNYISKLDYIKEEGKIFFHSVLSWVISLSDSY